MARYDIAVQKTTGAASGMICQIRAGASRDVEIFEIGVNVTTAVAGEIALIRPSAVGSTFTSSSVVAAWDPTSGAGVAVIDTAASTPPTIGTNYMRRWQFPGSIGAGVIWTFPQGLIVPVSASIAIWQLSALAVTYDVYISWNE